MTVATAGGVAMPLATAEVLRHLVAVPAVLMGLAFVRWADPIAEFYAAVFGSVGLSSFRRAYESDVGKWWVRIGGVAVVAIGVYWIVVGTG
jgi:hypothetical protein